MEGTVRRGRPGFLATPEPRENRVHSMMGLREQKGRKVPGEIQEIREYKVYLVLEV